MELEHTTELAKKEIVRLPNGEANAITRACLFEALLMLMKKKPFEEITVSELVLRAGVSRTTFYRNYSSIDQIIREPLKGLLEYVRATLNEPRYAENMRLWYVDTLTYLRDHHAVMLEMLQLATHGRLLDARALGGCFDVPCETPQQRLHYLAFNGATRELFTDWVTHQCQGDVAVLADTMFAVHQSFLKA